MAGGPLLLLLRNYFALCVCVCVCDHQAAAVDEVACGSFKTKEPPEIVATGYVIHSMEAALWAFYHSTTFKEGCLKAGEQYMIHHLQFGVYNSYNYM